MLKVINNKIVLTIGSTYTQYPNTKPPAELFGGTWTAMYENEGVFFRTPGGTAGAFNSGIQAAANTAHDHDRGTMEIVGEFGKQATTFQNSGNLASGAFKWNPGTSNHIGANSANYGGVMNFAASRSWSGRTSSDGVADGRPKNRTYRIWECIGV